MILEKKLTLWKIDEFNPGVSMVHTTFVGCFYKKNGRRLGNYVAESRLDLSLWLVEWVIFNNSGVGERWDITEL